MPVSTITGDKDEFLSKAAVFVTDWFTLVSSSIALVGPSGVPTGHTASVTLNNRWLTTVTGRLGYAWDRVLVYGKGGGAWVGSSDPSVTIDGLPTTFSSSNSNSGWTAG